MPNLIAIDPGTRHLGWAIFGQSRSKGRDSGPWVLLKAGCLSVPGKDWQVRSNTLLSGVRHLIRKWDSQLGVCEMFDVYTGRNATAANAAGSIAKLAYIIGGINAVFLGAKIPLTLTKSRQWKGNVPKPITQRRILRRYGFTHKRHDAIDAVGIGDWYIRKSGLLRPD